MRFKASLMITLVNKETTLKLLSSMIADFYTLDLEVKLLDIKIWRFDHIAGDALLFQDVPLYE